MAGDLGSVPMDEATPRRTRLRRGGPHAPFPVLPLIAALTGIGVAYVSQSAHSTAATYQATSLVATNQLLQNQDAQLNDDLARLQSTERIVAAAQKMGMRPAAHWTYLSTPLTPVVPAPSSQLTGNSTAHDQNLIAQLIADVSSIFGVGGRTTP